MPKRPSFQPYRKDEGEAYSRNLPHWRQAGATYFVTFRLADALPKALVDQWDDEKRTWLAAFDIDYSPPSSRWQQQFADKLSANQKFRKRP